MKISPVVNSYYNNKNVLRSNSSQKKNISFGDSINYTKSDFAFFIHRKRKEVRILDEKISEIKSRIKNIMIDLNKVLKEKEEAASKLKNLEEKYQSYNPKPEEFMDDVDFGKMQYKERIGDYNHTDLSEFLDWPFYVP